MHEEVGQHDDQDLETIRIVDQDQDGNVVDECDPHNRYRDACRPGTVGEHGTRKRGRNPEDVPLVSWVAQEPRK